MRGSTGVAGCSSWHLRCPRNVGAVCVGGGEVCGSPRRLCACEDGGGPGSRSSMTKWIRPRSSEYLQGRHRVTYRDVTLARYNTLKRRASHGLDGGRRVTGRRRTCSHRVAYRNIALARYNTLKRRASHGLDGGRHVTGRVPLGGAAWCRAVGPCAVVGAPRDEVPQRCRRRRPRPT